MRAAVVGHVEWVRFADVERVPSAGEIVHARESWIEPAGGGAVAAVRLLELAGQCDFLTAVGNDEPSRLALAGLGALGLRVHAGTREEPHRQAFTFLSDEGERTITLLGPKLVPYRSDPLPWDDLAQADAVYFTGGDPDALRAARQGRVLVATARELPTLQSAGVELDALVHSGTDLGERYEPGQLDPPPKLVVTTMARDGGAFVTGEQEGTYAAAELPGPLADAYGAGDSFAAGLAFALARGDSVEAALAFAAGQGAAAMTIRGAYG
ncbi:MAG: ribokinase [Actinobacteria bacterium]|nr:ribokinase [Actinomycetota bacterium]